MPETEGICLETLGGALKRQKWMLGLVSRERDHHHASANAHLRMTEHQMPLAQSCNKRLYFFHPT